MIVHKGQYVGIWMLGLSADAYTHERSDLFKTFVKASIARELHPLNPSNTARWGAGDTFNDHPNEVAWRAELQSSLTAAQKPGRTLVELSQTEAVAATCYPSEDGGWIRIRAYPLRQGQTPWQAREATASYLAELRRLHQPDPSPDVQANLAAIPLYLVAVWGRANATPPPVSG